MASCPFIGPIISVTGDCTNNGSGAFEVVWDSQSGPFIIQPISPSGGIIGPTSSTAYTQNSLTAGTYTYTITDSCLPNNNIFPFTVYISSGSCVSLNESGTFCGLDNGTITATTTNFYNNAPVLLYNINDNYITSALSLSNQTIFTNLSADTYYVISDDGGGCTGRSESCIIKSSQTLDYGFYVIDNGSCSPPSNAGGGKIYITGLTGNPPYSYLWSPGGQTTSSISGLTSGPYNVTVTDGQGCVTSKGTIVNTVPALAVTTMVVTIPPSCFGSNGEVQVSVSGGTAPYFYQGSNGFTQVSFSSVYTFTGLSSGPFSVQVTDAGLCTTTQNTVVSSPAGFSITSVNVIPANCSNSDGQINVQLFGGTGPYTYQLTSGSTTLQTTTFSTSINFYPLSPGTYNLLVSAGTCVYTNTYVVSSITQFNVSATTTGTTCGLDNGIISFDVSGGTGLYAYDIIPLNNQAYSNTAQFAAVSAFTATNIPCGPYIARVTDQNSNPACYIDKIVNIPCSSSVSFTLVGTNSYLGSNGTATAYITSGTPPFTLNWSPNVNGQTGTNVTSLSAGTYSLTITDSNGCTETRNVVIQGFDYVSSYETFTICNDTFSNSNSVVQKGPRQMLLEGFSDLTSGDTGCTLNMSIFEAVVEVDGTSVSQSYYTGYTLNDYPTINQWVDKIKEMLLDFPGIDAVNANLVGNTIKIINDCKNPISLGDKNVTVDFKITYDVSCIYCS
jgi:hypothetical protein